MVGSGTGAGRMGQVASLWPRREPRSGASDDGTVTGHGPAADLAGGIALGNALAPIGTSVSGPRSEPADRFNGLGSAVGPSKARPQTRSLGIGLVGGLPLTAGPIDGDETPDRRAERRLAERRAAVARYDAVLGRIAGSEPETGVAIDVRV